ncbi:DUF5362 family protein [Seonamhaeicola sp.]|uniref:DUF5362 family protein n=1 Tax=Seonamhaeicola sp. TaxID=1912245 RepID=UPI00260E0F33|nr:DUF5362 family protein [Seonamhaeicola sp.]
MEEKSVFENFELDINQEIKGYLSETSKWAYYLAILGFVGIGLMVLLGIFMAFFQGLAGSGVDALYGVGYSIGVGLVYIVIAAVYFFPILYLFNFSKHMKSALKLSNNKDFITAFSNLKSHYKFVGIFSIVIISIYILIFMAAIAGAALF